MYDTKRITTKSQAIWFLRSKHWRELNQHRHDLICRQRIIPTKENQELNTLQTESDRIIKLACPPPTISTIDETCDQDGNPLPHGRCDDCGKPDSATHVCS
jgi:hypothetical protein